MTIVLKRMLFLLLFSTNIVLAQSNYIDYNPQYKRWTEDYQIDKIEYTNKSTIIYLRFAKENSKYDSPSFYPSKGEYAWVLETDAGTIYDFDKLVNVKKNDVVEIAELGSEPQTVSSLTKEKKAKTFFTCEIHFKRLPIELETVSLIEGKGHRTTRNHLNCLDIQLKNTNRGAEKDEEKQIKAFEKERLAPTKARSQIAVYDDLQDFGEREALDENPKYKPWQKDYQIDKIVYTKTETVFFLRMILKGGVNALFYPVEGEYPWYLQEVGGDRRYKLKAVTNIRKNGVLNTKKLGDDLLTVTSVGVRDVQFTCRVHFQRLPNEIKKVHLIEGEGEAKNKDHFNYFNIRLNSQ